MKSVRRAPADGTLPKTPCLNCGDAERHWDRIAGKTYCPSCVESLAQGEAGPICARTELHRCAVCHHLGTIRYVTFPLHSDPPVEIDFCGEHLRRLTARILVPHAFEQLRCQLRAVGVEAENVFLLHDAFYDANGRALQPIFDS